MNKDIIDNTWEHPTATTNYEEGGLAFTMDDYTELYTRVATCLFGEPKFYKEKDEEGRIVANNQDDALLALTQKIAKEDPDFIMKLAAYARNELYLRTIPVILWVEAAVSRPKQNNAVIRQYAPSILKRADEPGEAIAYYIAKNGSFLGAGKRYPNLAKKGVVLSHCIQKGIEDAIFENYDTYQISKYNRESAGVKWRDVINLVHPNPEDMRLRDKKNPYNTYRSEEWARTFKAVLSNKLEPATTWEDTLMTWRENGFESKSAAWDSIIPKMGYMALLRNLRNFTKEGISDKSLEFIVNKLKDPEEVKRSKQFPYRFYSAYKALESSEDTQAHGFILTKLQAAVEYAMDASVQYNLPRWPGITYFATDFSHSMDGEKVSQYSEIDRKQVATIMMCLSNALCEKSICSIFADTHKLVSIRERDGILSNVQRLLENEVGTSTNAYLSVEYLLQNNIKVDRMVLFSDMQCYNTNNYNNGNHYWMRSYGGQQQSDPQFAPKWLEYKHTVNPDAYMYSIDLAGYGTSQLPQHTNRLCLLGGFSDKILQFVPIFESENTGAMDKIKSVTPETYKKKFIPSKSTTASD